MAGDRCRIMNIKSACHRRRGFIGSHIVERLISAGMDVTVIDDLSVGRIENMPKGARFYRASILDPSVVSRSLEG